MADATDSKSVVRKGVWVQVPPRALVVSSEKISMETDMIFRSSTRLVERRLRRTSSTLREKSSELSIALEQFDVIEDEFNETEVRALVSETPLAEHEHREVLRHREAMNRHIEALRMEIAELQREQDRLLDQLRK